MDGTHSFLRIAAARCCLSDAELKSRVSSSACTRSCATALGGQAPNEKCARERAPSASRGSMAFEFESYAKQLRPDTLLAQRIHRQVPLSTSGGCPPCAAQAFCLLTEVLWPYPATRGASVRMRVKKPQGAYLSDPRISLSVHDVLRSC